MSLKILEIREEQKLNTLHINSQVDVLSDIEVQGQINIQDSINVVGEVNLFSTIEVHPEDKVRNYYTKTETDEKLSILREEMVPRNLSILPQASEMTDRNQQLVYINDNGTPSKMTVRDLLSKVIRTDTEQPSDMQEGEYLFKTEE